LIDTPGRPYDHTKSATYKAIEERVKESEAVAVYDKDDFKLQSVQFTGEECFDTFILELTKFKRSTHLK